MRGSQTTVTATAASVPIFPITLCVMTRNEAHNIARCFDSVPLLCEKLFIDSGSSDGTREFAAARGAR
jgi:glycosyltransferase involved in cell wall biosynthesis